MAYSAQDYWNDLAALRTQYTARLAQLERERDAALVALPAAKPIVDAFHAAAQSAQAARASVYADIDGDRDKALAAAAAKRPEGLAKAERTLRDARELAERQRDSARQKAKSAYDEAIREIEAKHPLHEQTEPKEEAADEYQRQLAAADETRNRAFDWAWGAYQNDNRDVLDDERIASENAESEAQRARAAADEHYDDSLRNADAILRSRLAAVAGDVQIRFDAEHERIATEWESKKDALQQRYRGDNPRTA